MDLLTYTEAAARAGVGEQTIRRRVKDGTLQEVMDGNRPKVRLDELKSLYPSVRIEASGECRVISFSNQKGGVGKTTTCANLATVFAARLRVLAIDCDPQGNLSQAFGLDPDTLKVTTYNVLVDRVPVERAIVAPLDELPRLHLIGANLDLAEAEQKLMAVVAGEMRLRQVIDTVRHQYDLILLDSPPSLGILTMNVLTAATDVIIPVNVSSFSLRGLNKLMGIIEEIRDLNPDLKSIRPLANEKDHTNLSKDLRIRLGNEFEGVCFTSSIRKAQIIKDEQSQGKPVTLKAGEAVSLDYLSLAKEIMGEPFGGESKHEDLHEHTSEEVREVSNG